MIFNTYSQVINRHKGVIGLLEKLRAALKRREITVYRLSKITGIKYELLRRSLTEERKLTAEELVEVLKAAGIGLEEII